MYGSYPFVIEKSKQNNSSVAFKVQTSETTISMVFGTSSVTPAGVAALFAFAFAFPFAFALAFGMCSDPGEIGVNGVFIYVYYIYMIGFIVDRYIYIYYQM